jgi:gas vesicle protein
MKSSLRVTIAALAGLSTGVLLGILFAPHKGSKTRRNIARKGEELSEEIKSRFNQFGEFISERLDSSKGIYKFFLRTGRTSS